MSMTKKMYLVLENGRVFEGYSFGAEQEVVGELVFTTGMTGYLETLTDKRHYGQIVVHTFPLIGNYGVIPADFEHETPCVKGYIVKDWCQEPSNFRSEGPLDAFLKTHQVTGLYGIDTRELTKILRQHGTMNGMITPDPPAGVPEPVRQYAVSQALAAVSVRQPFTETGGSGRYKVALLDCGYRESTRRALLDRDCEVTVFPYNTPAKDILSYQPDGILLSEGPGDPRENTALIWELKTLLDAGIPLFGIGLGHQLLALACGFQVERLPHGHRGANYPARDLTTGRVYITSQNHGYVVVQDSVDPKVAQPWFVNVNDGTNEGLLYRDRPVFSVQFQPRGGPKDTASLYDRFIKLMEGTRHAVR